MGLIQFSLIGAWHRGMTNPMGPSWAEHLSSTWQPIWFPLGVQLELLAGNFVRFLRQVSKLSQLKLKN